MTQPAPAPALEPGTDEHPVASGSFDLLLALAGHWKLLTGLPLGAGLLALGLAFLVEPTFTASTRILPPQQQQSTAAAMVAQQLGPLAGLAGGALRSPSDQYVALLKSRSIADQLTARFDLMRVYDAKLRQDARRRLGDRSSIASGRDGLITIQVDDKDPTRAAALANAYVEELGEMLKRLALTEAQQRRIFFSTQLESVRDSLKRAQQALAGAGVGESVLKAEPKAAAESVARLKAAVTAKEVQIKAMRGYLSDTSPDFRQAQQELAALRAQLAREERADTGSPTPPAQDYISLYRDFKYHETLFELMARQYEIARLDEAREGALIQVVDGAIPPERKSRPKRGQVALVTLLVTALVVSVALIALAVWQRAAGTPGGRARLAALADALASRRR